MHDPEQFVTAVSQSKIRALLIGRRALVALGAPVMTADYDYWIHRDDIEQLNELASAFDLTPNRTPTEARSRGRYVLENDDRVDVVTARSMSYEEGGEIRTLDFDPLWKARQYVELADGNEACLPSTEDLIRTKRISLRPKDLEDILFLEQLLEQDMGKS